MRSSDSTPSVSPDRRSSSSLRSAHSSTSPGQCRLCFALRVAISRDGGHSGSLTLRVAISYDGGHKS